MRKSLKRILTAALSALAFVAAGFGVSALKTVDVAKAEGELAITGRTLNVSNNVNVVFLIQAEVGDAEKVKVVAKEVNAVDGTEEDPVTLSATGTYTDESTATVYHQYIYKGVEAKEMPNVVYAYAYHVDNPTVLSATRKFSIIEYAHTSLASGADSKLDTLIKATLDYGEAAAAFENQTLPADYLNDYKLWELDESTNATFADGFDYSYVYVGEVVNLKPTTGYVVADGMDGFTKNEDDTYSYTVSESLPDMSGVFVEDEGISAFDKVTAEKESLTLDFSEVIVGTTKELPTETSYPGVSITWSGDGVTDNSVTFNTVGSVTLTATISCEGTESQTREFTITVKENPYPVEGKAYALKTTGQYAIKPTANNYLSISAEENDAESFYFKKVDNVYYIYYMLDETNIKYVEHSSSTALKFVDATVEEDIPSGCKGWTLDVNSKKIISNVDSSRKLGYNVTATRFSTYGVDDTQYSAVWFEEIRELTATEKLSKVAEGISIGESVTGEKSIELPPIDNKYGATLAWDEKTDTNNLIEISDYILTVLANESTEIVEVVITLTLTLDGETLKKDYIIQLNPQPSQGGDEPVLTEKTATLDLSNSANRIAFSTTEQIWEENDIKLINAKGSGSNIADYTPPRFYKGSTVTVQCSGAIKQIVFVCSSNSYATALQEAIGASATASGSTVTVTLETPATTWNVTLTAGQVRMGGSITVTYIG